MAGHDRQGKTDVIFGMGTAIHHKFKGENSDPSFHRPVLCLHCCERSTQFSAHQGIVAGDPFKIGLGKQTMRHICSGMPTPALP